MVHPASLFVVKIEGNALVLNLTSKRVEWNGRDIGICGKTYLLLEKITLHYPAFVPHDQIFWYVYEEENDTGCVNMRRLYSLLNRLRKTLRTVHCPIIIDTEYGNGLRLSQKYHHDKRAIPL
jgi:DNA-binding response OmpR family regulator